MTLKRNKLGHENVPNAAVIYFFCLFVVMIAKIIASHVIVNSILIQYMQIEYYSSTNKSIQVKTAVFT